VLDGVEGYILCHLLAKYEFLIRAKTLKLGRQVTTKPSSDAAEAQIVRNRFFIWNTDDPNPAEFVPGEYLTRLGPCDARYFVGTLQHVDELLPDEGMTFVLTWFLDSFHPVMRDAIVLLVGEERHQKVWYQHRVRAIFRTGGLRPNPIGQTWRLPLSIASRCLLRDTRNVCIQFCRLLKYGPPGKATTPLYEIPIGYHALVECDPPPVELRPVAVFFAGSLMASGWSLRPSVAARRQMAAAVAAARKEVPQCRIECALSWRFPRTLGPEAYTQALANARIALAPRGNFDETFRLIEACKLGRVVVSEPLPPRWYYQGCPAVTLEKWSELPGILKYLLNEPERLKDLSAQGRRWWDSTISELSIARFIAESLTGSGTPGKERPTPF
jgi:hypothetical protein